MTQDKPTRVAIVSDTHGVISPDVVAVVKSCDIAVHAGDIGRKRVLEMLKPASGEILAVRGNNDSAALWADEEADAVNALPQVAMLELPGGTLVVEHGHRHGWHTPDHEKMRNAHPQAKMIVYGHTHIKTIDQTDTPWVVNPGAAGNTRNNGGPSCLVLNASQAGWEIEKHRF
jgi:putative phosphoesterase